jgi:hypothetical protein
VGAVKYNLNDAYSVMATERKQSHNPKKKRFLVDEIDNACANLPITHTPT